MHAFIEDQLLLQIPAFDHVRDVLEQMKRSESSTYSRSFAKPVEPFSGLWRQQIVEWMYTLVKFCKLRHEAATAGAYFLDVAVARGVIETPSDYQLGAMAALYLGLKVFDSPSTRVVKLSSLVKLGNGAFEEDDIVQMEKKMLKATEWRLSPPTANCFLQQYLELLPTPNESTKNQIEEMALQAIEVCVAHEHFSSIKASISGFAALLIALDRYLEKQKAVTVPCDCIITLWQVRSFLYNMSHISQLDHASLPITQTVSLLERVMKRQPMSEPRSRSSSPLKGSTKQAVVHYDQTRGIRSVGTSPNNVALQ